MFSLKSATHKIVVNSKEWFSNNYNVYGLQSLWLISHNNHILCIVILILIMEIIIDNYSINPIAMRWVEFLNIKSISGHFLLLVGFQSNMRQWALEVSNQISGSGHSGEVVFWWGLGGSMGASLVPDTINISQYSRYQYLLVPIPSISDPRKTPPVLQ